MHQVNATQAPNVAQESFAPKMIVKMNALQGYAYVSLNLFERLNRNITSIMFIKWRLTW